MIDTCNMDVKDKGYHLCFAGFMLSVLLHGIFIALVLVIYNNGVSSAYRFYACFYFQLLVVICKP